MEAFAIPLLLMVGGLLALQAAANVQLSGAMGSSIGASTLQLCLGAALLLALAAVVGTLSRLQAVTEAPAWHLVGGLGSALYITAGILLFPRVGAVVAVGLFIAGQMAASVFLDAAGWLGVTREPLGVISPLGVLGVAAGTVLIVRAQAAGALRVTPAWVMLGLAAGAALPVQGAINAQLNGELDAATAVGALSFLVATAAMAVALLASLAAGGRRPRVAPLRTVPWWGWLGGLCGATYVTAVFLLIPEIGAATVVVLTVAGQQLASVAVDRYGLLHLPRREISGRRLTGVALLLAGAVLVTL